MELKTIEEIVMELQEPFGNEDIEWRIQSSGHKQGQDKPWAKVIPYVTNRAIQTRLDDVCGVFGWRNEFKVTPNGKGTLCGISIKDPESGEWITKWDGAEDTHIEPTKGGLSDAMKRAAVQFGIGRDLYKLDEQFAEAQWDRPNSKKWNAAQLKDKRWFYWKTPTLDLAKYRYPAYMDSTPRIIAAGIKEFTDICEKYEVDPSEFLDHNGQDHDKVKDMYASVRTWLNMPDRRDFIDKLMIFRYGEKDEDPVT